MTGIFPLAGIQKTQLTLTLAHQEHTENLPSLCGKRQCFFLPSKQFPTSFLLRCTRPGLGHSPGTVLRGDIKTGHPLQMRNYCPGPSNLLLTVRHPGAREQEKAHSILLKERRKKLVKICKCTFILFSPMGKNS